MISFLRPKLNVPQLDWGQTTRQGGVSSFGESCNKDPNLLAFRQNTLNLATHVNDDPEAVAENWRRFGEASRWTRESLATCQQVHGDEVIEVTTGGHLPLEADALISRKPGLAVGVFTADCVPILIVDPIRKHVAAIHCGWKGVALNLTAKTIAQLNQGDCSRNAKLLIWIGASIQCESYEVGPEVALQFEKSMYSAGKAGKFQLDLPKAVKYQLTEAGIYETNIEDCEIDSYTSDKIVFSHRKELGITGRMMSFVGFYE